MYYKYHDLAIESCKAGKMPEAYEHINKALKHAKDPDLKSEGLYIKSILDQGLCQE